MWEIKYLILLASVLFVGFGALADEQKLVCPQEQQRIVLCRARLPFDPNNLPSLIQTTILCEGADGIYFNSMMGPQEMIGNFMKAKPYNHPGDPDFQIPAKYKKIYGVDGGALCVTEDGKSAVMAVSFERALYLSEMDCE